MLCAITLLATGASAFAPATKPAFNLQQQQRASAPLMQFNFFNDDRSDLEKYFDNEKKGKNKRTATKSRKTAKRTGTKSRVRGEFYDDEADTTAARRLSATPRRLLLLTSFIAAVADDEASSLLSAAPTSSALTKIKAPFARLLDVLYFRDEHDGEAVASC